MITANGKIFLITSTSAKLAIVGHNWDYVK